jgi:formylglycine-generating enzyme required for sulfatase activity
MISIFSRYQILSGMIFITFSWGTFANATPTAVADDSTTNLYMLDHEDKVEPLLVSNNKGYRIQCGDAGNKKMAEGLGFSSNLGLLPRKEIDDSEILNSDYHDQPTLCKTQNQLYYEEKQANKSQRYFIKFRKHDNLLYEIGCQGLLDALGLNSFKATKITDDNWQLVDILKNDSIQHINCKSGVPPGKFRDAFKDSNSDFGPEMVGIPGGEFRMGDIRGKGDKDEKPVHKVSLKSFAISRYEITFADYDRFASATKRSNKPYDEGWGRDKRPVINVSQQNAIAYTQWLSKQTGKRYRLPTEAEWEYAARAGTITKYSWGNRIKSKQANYCQTSQCWKEGQTKPVGSFVANAFGVYDMVGNVLEWTCSTYEHRYQGTEQKCLNSNNSSIVLRGGSFIQNDVRIARRYRILSYLISDSNIGFRVVRVSQ